MIYGHDKTVHRNDDVNVEVDDDGKVVSVWYRCMPLPFTQTVVDERRAKEMRQMYERDQRHGIVAIEFAENVAAVPQQKQPEDQRVPDDPIRQMSNGDMMAELNRDELFKATIAALNALLIAKGVYSSDEFDAYLRESIIPRLRRQRERKPAVVWR